jgi:hypothetical protein
MLVSCFGIHKSASTFAYRLATATSIHIFKGEVLTGSDVEKINAKFVDLNQDLINSADELLIQKTHAGSDINLSKLDKEGTLKVIVSIRDLRDIALSMLDAGKQEREAGKKNQMAGVRNFDDAIVQIHKDLIAHNKWCDSTQPLYVPYPEIREFPEKVVKKMANFLFDQKLNRKQCIAISDSVSRNTIRLNKGIHQRFLTEMADDDSQKILDSFKDYYKNFDNIL